jgi:hypothetical protein
VLLPASGGLDMKCEDCKYYAKSYNFFIGENYCKIYGYAKAEGYPSFSPKEVKKNE